MGDEMKSIVQFFVGPKMGDLAKDEKQIKDTYAKALRDLFIFRKINRRINEQLTKIVHAKGHLRGEEGKVNSLFNRRTRLIIRARKGVRLLRNDAQELELEETTTDSKTRRVLNELLVHMRTICRELDRTLNEQSTYVITEKNAIHRHYHEYEKDEGSMIAFATSKSERMSSVVRLMKRIREDELALDARYEAIRREIQPLRSKMRVLLEWAGELKLIDWYDRIDKKFYAQEKKISGLRGQIQYRQHEMETREEYLQKHGGSVPEDWKPIESEIKELETELQETEEQLVDRAFIFKLINRKRFSWGVAVAAYTAFGLNCLRYSALMFGANTDETFAEMSALQEKFA